MNIFAYKQGRKFSYDVECTGQIDCKHALCESMPPQPNDRCAMSFDGCKNNDAIVESLGWLLFQIKKEMRRLAFTEETD